METQVSFDGLVEKMVDFDLNQAKKATLLKENLISPMGKQFKNKANIINYMINKSILIIGSGGF